jgi:hypothetical protein
MLILLPLWSPLGGKLKPFILLSAMHFTLSLLSRTPAIQLLNTGLKSHDEETFHTAGKNAESSHSGPQQTTVMAKFLNLAVWNANGLAHRKKSFLPMT